MFFNLKKEMHEIDVAANFRRCVSGVILDRRFSHALPIAMRDKKNNHGEVKCMLFPCRRLPLGGP